MCSRAERKRRRRAVAIHVGVDLGTDEGSWIVWGGRGTGMARAEAGPNVALTFESSDVSPTWTTVPLAMAFDALKDHTAIDTTGEPVPEVTQTPKSAVQIIDETMTPILRDLARRPSPFAIDTTGEDVTDVRRLPSKEPT